MSDTILAAQRVGRFIDAFIAGGRFRLKFRVVAQRGSRADVGQAGDLPAVAHDTRSNEQTSRPQQPKLCVEFTGPDTPILLARNGNVLNALEHIASQILRLEPEEHDWITFDAEQFKANRERQMREMARSAIEEVKATDKPHSFPVVSSRERRAMHMLLRDSGMPTASSGDGPSRFVVLYPMGEEPLQARSHGVSNPSASPASH
jgi:spoIIIJ-associated protein